MYPTLIDGKIFIPKRAELEDGTIGDAYIELKPDDPNYDSISNWIKETSGSEEKEGKENAN